MRPVRPPTARLLLRRVVPIVGMLLAAPVLQATVLFHAAPGGITPDLVLLLSMAVAFAAGSFWGAACGALGGLLLGALLGEDLAPPLAALYGGVGWIAGLLGEGPGFRTLPGQAVAAGLLTLMVVGLQTVLFWQAELPWDLRAGLLARLALWHSVLALPLCAGVALLLGDRTPLTLPGAGGDSG